MADSSTNHEHTYDVFLSHSSLDKPIVLELAQRLRADGLRVWYDEWEIKVADSIPSKIEQGLENSRVLILCMSKNAFGSDWATLESQTFRFRDPLNKLRRFIPLRLDDTEPPGSLKQFKYVDWRGKDHEESYQSLLSACVGTAANFSSLQQPTAERTSHLKSEDVSMNSFSGKNRNKFCERLNESWRPLANELEIPDQIRNTWEKGHEADGIWRYLESRSELNRLPTALDSINRKDLANLFSTAKQREIHTEIAAVIESLGIDRATQSDNDGLVGIIKALAHVAKAEKESLDKVRAAWQSTLEAPLGDGQSDLKQLYQDLPKLSGLEAAIVTVSSSGDDFSGISFAENLRVASRRICYIGTKVQFLGTGFLVSADKLMTNYHVWEAASKLKGPLFAFFDHDGRLSANDLPSHEIDKQPLKLSVVNQLDYAILKLKTSVDSTRGFFSLCDYRPKFREALHVVGHPGKQHAGNTVPSMLAIRSGVLFDINSYTQRISYSAETAPGSSGSPVFRENFDLIGLHHHGEAGMNNHGIPMWAIIKDLGQTQQLVTVTSSKLKPIKFGEVEASVSTQNSVVESSTKNSDVEAGQKKTFENKVRLLHEEIKKALKKLTTDALKRICAAFEIDPDQKTSHSQLSKHILEDSGLTSVVNLLSTPYEECGAADKKCIAEILQHLIPLRYDQSLFDRLRKKLVGGSAFFWMSDVANKPIAEVIMAGVDGMPVRLKDDVGHGGFSLNRNPEMGAPMQGSEPTDDDVTGYMADLYNAIGDRLSASSLPRTTKGVEQLAKKLDSRIRTLAQRHKRTVYCVIELAREDDARQHELAIIKRVSGYVPNLAMIEYNTLKDDPSEEDFMNAFHWVLKIGN